jgi:hypothetical protein
MAVIAALTAMGQLKGATELQIKLDEQRNQVKTNEIALINTISRVDKARSDRGKASADNAKKRAEDEKKIQEEIAQAQLKADAMIEEANIMQISNEIERERQLAIFKENQAFEQLDKTKLTQEQIEALTEQHQFRLEAIEDRAQERQIEQMDKEVEAYKNMLDKKVELEKKAAEKAKKLADEEAKKQIDLERSVLDMKNQLLDNSLAALSANLKEGSKAAKAMAVAQATIDTYRGAQAAFASTAANPISVANPAAPFLAAAAAVAMGIANVRSILSTPEQGGSPSNNTMSAPNLNVGSPAQTPNMMFENSGVEQNAGGSVDRVMVVDYTDIEEKGSEVNSLRSRVQLT